MLQNAIRDDIEPDEVVGGYEWEDCMMLFAIENDPSTSKSRKYCKEIAKKVFSSLSEEEKIQML